jgi:hypothetical protein
MLNTYKLKINYDPKTRQVELCGLLNNKICDYELLFGSSTILDIFIYLYNNDITNISLDTFKNEYILYFYRQSSYDKFRVELMNYLLKQGNSVV